MMDVPPTPPETPRRAREQALKTGLKFVYTGNIRDRDGQSTYCQCGQEVIGRDGYDITAWQLDDDGRCRACQTRLPGHFTSKPGRWGARRLPLTF